MGVLVQAVHPVLMLRGDTREAGPAPPTLLARPFPGPPPSPSSQHPQRGHRLPQPHPLHQTAAGNTEWEIAPVITRGLYFHPVYLYLPTLWS